MEMLPHPGAEYSASPLPPGEGKHPLAVGAGDGSPAQHLGVAGLGGPAGGFIRWRGYSVTAGRVVDFPPGVRNPRLGEINPPFDSLRAGSAGLGGPAVGFIRWWEHGGMPGERWIFRRGLETPGWMIQTRKAGLGGPAVGFIRWRGHGVTPGRVVDFPPGVRTPRLDDTNPRSGFGLCSRRIYPVAVRAAGLVW
jgi:hypothetical protein